MIKLALGLSLAALPLLLTTAPTPPVVQGLTGRFTQEPSQAAKAQATLTELPASVRDAELRLLGGKTLKLSQLSGNVVVLNLFATWCGPCRLESPVLAELHQEYKDRGVEVIELSTENPEASKETVREWVWQFRLPYPVGWLTPEVAEILMQGRGAIPQAFVIDRDGRIVRRFIGFNATSTKDQLRVSIEEALK